MPCSSPARARAGRRRATVVWYREFLQALFISRRVYPIAYDKWIREQVVEILGLEPLHRELTALFEIARLESDELARKASRLGALLEHYAVE